MTHARNNIYIDQYIFIIRPCIDTWHLWMYLRLMCT